MPTTRPSVKPKQSLEVAEFHKFAANPRRPSSFTHPHAVFYPIFSLRGFPFTCRKECVRSLPLHFSLGKLKAMRPEDHKKPSLRIRHFERRILLSASALDLIAEPTKLETLPFNTTTITGSRPRLEPADIHWIRVSEPVTSEPSRDSSASSATMAFPGESISTTKPFAPTNQPCPAPAAGHLRTPDLADDRSLIAESTRSATEPGTSKAINRAIWPADFPPFPLFEIIIVNQSMIAKVS